MRGDPKAAPQTVKQSGFCRYFGYVVVAVSLLPSSDTNVTRTVRLAPLRPTAEANPTVRVLPLIFTLPVFLSTFEVTSMTEYPGKGRATGGVRCHRFLKGEDTLLLAWAGPAPAWAAAASGAPIDLPAPDGRRDGSGVPAGQPIVAVSSAGG